MPSISQILRKVTGNTKLQKFCKLRCAVDWQTILYKNFVSLERWKHLQGGVTARVDGVTLEFDTRLQGATLILKTEGWYIKLLDPTLNWDEIDKKSNIPSYGAEIQAQGRFFAGGGNFIKALEDIEELLGLRNDLQFVDSDGVCHFYDTSVSDEDRIPGRCDLALDLWLRDHGKTITGADIYRALICDGNPGDTENFWSTRARRAQVGASPRNETENKSGEVAALNANAVTDDKKNITLYLGTRGHVQCCIYRKDADYEGNAKELLEPQWKDAGWIKGEGAVVRIEFRLSREIIREWEWNLKGVGPRKGSDLTLVELYRSLDSAWQRCLDLYRHAPKTTAQIREEKQKKEKIRARDREESRIWEVARTASPAFTAQRPAEIVHAKRTFDAEQLRVKAWHTLVNLQEAFDDAEPEELARWVRSHPAQVEEYRQSTAWRGFKEKLANKGDEAERQSAAFEHAQSLDVPDREHGCTHAFREEHERWMKKQKELRKQRAAANSKNKTKSRAS